MYLIETQRLTKDYGKARAVEEVDLAVEQGEIFGFIGPNGAGKSTTIRGLLGLILPTQGKALLFGKESAKHPEVRAEVGYLHSEVFYYDTMRVIDLLKYSATFYHKDCTKRMQELAERMDLDLKKKIRDLSFGNKKKVGIVQGLLHQPKLIILDEPTSGLDPLMQQTFFDLILEENKRGATVFFSSHILGEVQRLCNRVALIKKGRILKIEEMSAISADSYKNIKLEADQPVSASQLSQAVVSRLQVEGNRADFIFKGNLSQLLQTLSTLSLTNLSITEPDLEDIFLHYYTREDSAQ